MEDLSQLFLASMNMDIHGLQSLIRVEMPAVDAIDGDSNPEKIKH